MTADHAQHHSKAAGPTRSRPGDRLRALIIGSGIAGPVLAMYLRRAGISLVIYEGRAQPDDEAGAFLNLAPNGVSVLDGLALRDDVARYGHPTSSIAFLNHRGRRLGEMPQETILIKRGLLNRALREAALQRGVSLEFGKRLVEVETPDPHTVIARFADGSSAKGAFLVGADGINSATRQSILPDAPRPAYTGTIGFGGFARDPSVPPTDGVMLMTFGRKGFFGYQVVGSGEVYWFSNLGQPNEPEPEAHAAGSDQRWQARLLELHAADHPPIPQIIRSTNGPIGAWPTYDLPPLPRWHRGPVGLIGDAAHATSPHVGQGASLAMEDAVVLAKCLRDIADAQKAFDAFERLRRDRVEQLVEEARRTGNRKVPANPVTRGIRDLLLPVFLRLGARSAQRVSAYRVEWERPIAALSPTPVLEQA